MEKQSKYDIQLDFKGYMIDTAQYRVAPAPLLGTKFGTGRSAYSELDFWQVGAVTDFTKGMNQKFMVDPSMCFYSEGLDLSKPGEISLERDTESFDLFTDAAEELGTVVSHYRTLDKLYIGSSNGSVYSTKDGIKFVQETTGAGTATGFYEIQDKIFVAAGAGAIKSCSDQTRTDFLNGSVSIGASTIVLDDASNFSTSGTGFIEKDSFTWTGKSSNTLTGVTNVTKAHDDGAAVAENNWTTVAMSTEFPNLSDEGTPTNDHKIYADERVYQVIKVPMGGDTFHTLDLVLKKIGTPAGNLTVSICTEDADNVGEPDTSDAQATFTIAPGDVTTSYSTISKTISAFNLKAGIKYFIYASSNLSVDLSNCFVWGYEEKGKAYYEFGNGGWTDDGNTTWNDEELRDYYFRLKRDTISNLYFPMVESDYALAWFNDGIRQSIDGFNWTPEPPDPLWVMPDGEGVPLNAKAIPNNFISGSQRGLWSFIGGSSGMNLWKFPDYTNEDNFRGMDIWSRYCIFSIEDQGLYYTNGAEIFPTTMTYLEEGYTVQSCRFIYSSGWDVYAAVSEDGSTWHLARCNMSYNKQPKYWWIVKELDSEPLEMAAWDRNKVFIFYNDGTVEYIDKESGPYVSSGYMETSIMDENLIKLEKQYRSLSVMYDSFPGAATTTIAYNITQGQSYPASQTSSTFTGNGSTSESVYTLPNPTLSNRIQIKTTFNTSDTTKTPVATDITWKYILERPKEDTNVGRVFNLVFKCEDGLEFNDGTLTEFNQVEPRQRRDIVDELWAVGDKKQVLNYIGADNKSELGLKIQYTGAGAGTMKIDRTNYTITTYIDGAEDETYDYEDKTITQVATNFNNLANYSCSVHQDQSASRTAHDLEPRSGLDISGEAYMCVGSDVKAVIVNPGSMTQQKDHTDGRGSDSIRLSLREA